MMTTSRSNVSGVLVFLLALLSAAAPVSFAQAGPGESEPDERQARMLRELARVARVREQVMAGLNQPVGADRPGSSIPGGGLGASGVPDFEAVEDLRSRMKTVEGELSVLNRTAQNLSITRSVVAEARSSARMFGQGLERIECIPNHYCMIQLNQGEVLAGKPFLGDEDGWFLRDRYSGVKGNELLSIVVRPVDWNQRTNVIIQTGERNYLLELVSPPRPKKGGSVPYDLLVYFRYPDEGGLSISRSRVGGPEGREVVESAPSEPTFLYSFTAVQDNSGLSNSP